MLTPQIFRISDLSHTVIPQSDEDRIIDALKTDYSAEKERWFLSGYGYGCGFIRSKYPDLMTEYFISEPPPKNLPYYRKFENPKGRKFNVNKRK